MGLSSSTYEDLVKLIQSQDTLGLESYLESIDLDEFVIYFTEPYHEDPYYRSLLHHAVCNNNAQVLRVLLDFYASKSSAVPIDLESMGILYLSYLKHSYYSNKSLIAQIFSFYNSNNKKN